MSNKQLASSKRLVKGYKYRLYPTLLQAIILNQYLGCGRYVYNRLLAETSDQYQNWLQDNTFLKPDVSPCALTKASTTLRTHTDTPWLGAVPSIILQQKAIDLASAYTNFFSHKRGYPKFKKKGYNDSFRIVGQDSIRIVPEGIILPKMKEPIEIRWSRALPSVPTSYTVTRNSAGEYYILFICEYTPNRPSGTGKTGVDLGIKNLAHLSTGEVIPNPRPYERAQKHLAHLQRKLSKRIKDSKNYHKLRVKIAKLHQYIHNFRLDYFHKLTSRLVRENKAIAIEDLCVSNMVRNHKLSKSLLDSAFGLFRTILTYKVLESSGTFLFIADRWYPSTQLCNHCGQLPTSKIKLGVYEWTCEHCGTIHNRDWNASKNLEALIDLTGVEDGRRIIPVPPYTQHFAVL